MTITLTAAIFGAAAIGWGGVFLSEATRVAPEADVCAAAGATLFMIYAGVRAGPPDFAGIFSTVSTPVMTAYLLLGGSNAISDHEEIPR